MQLFPRAAEKLSVSLMPMTFSCPIRCVWSSKPLPVLLTRVRGEPNVARGQSEQAPAEMPSVYDLPSGWQGPFLGSRGPRILPGLPPTSGLSLRRSAANAFFPLPAALKAYSDTLIQVVAPLVTPIVAIGGPLSAYRVHGANIGGVSRFTESRLRNIVLYEREIWRVWRQYLSSPCSGGPFDATLPAEMPPSLMDYAYMRFQSDQDFQTTYKPFREQVSSPCPHRTDGIGGHPRCCPVGFFEGPSTSFTDRLGQR